MENYSDVVRRIREWMNWAPGAPVNDIAVVIMVMTAMTDARREETLSAMGAFFCTFCGSAKLNGAPCYCTRDD